MFAPLWNAPRQPALASCREEQEWNARLLAQPSDGAAMRLWRYGAPGVVLGCAQRAALDEVGPRAAAAGMEAVVRQAGGGAVLTGPWMLSASLLLPQRHPLASAQLVHSYRWLGELYAGVLRSLGVPAQALTPERARELQSRAGAQQLGWACYGGYSPWEVVVGDRKIVGLAQVRRRGSVLLVAGLQLARPDWGLLAQALGRPGEEAAALAACNTSCEEEAGGGDWLNAVAGPLRQALSYALFHLPQAQAEAAHEAEIY
jgi:lipoate-protein ligase A